MFSPVISWSSQWLCYPFLTAGHKCRWKCLHCVDLFKIIHSKKEQCTIVKVIFTTAYWYTSSCSCLHTCTHIHIHTDMHACMHTHMYTCACTPHTHTHTHTHAQAHTKECLASCNYTHFAENQGDGVSDVVPHFCRLTATVERDDHLCQVRWDQVLEQGLFT